MAVLYKAQRERIHIYPNRKPRADGGDPLLFWMWIDVILLILVIIPAILFTLLMKNPLGDRTVPFILCAALIWDVGHVCYLCRRITFSIKDRKIYNSILFVTWGKKSFDDIANIDISEQEILGHPHYSYIANLVDEDAAPIRLSPRARTISHLSRYYHEIIPLILTLPGMQGKAASHPHPEADGDAVVSGEEDSDQYIPDSVEADDDIADMEVAVDTVEVPIEDAADLLSGRSSTSEYFSSRTSDNTNADGRLESKKVKETPPRKGKPAPKDGKAAKDGAFVRRGNTYSRSLWLFNLALLLVITLVIAGLAFILLPFMGEYLRIVFGLFWLATLANGIYQLARENMDIHIDLDRRVLRFRTLFGLKRHEYGFDKITHFNMKSQIGVNALCVGLKSHKVDPTIFASTSAKKIKEVYRQTCAIIEIDPKKFWKS